MIASLRRAVLPGVATLALALSACSASNESDAATGGGESGSELSGQYTIGGASSQEAAQLAWTTGFNEVHPDVTLTYEPVGSGGGRENFISGAYLVGASDTYLEGEELAAATERCNGEPPIEIPNYVSPIAIIFNVDGVDELKLSPSTLGGIFAGDISRWDDPAIAEENPDADLPAEPINAVHRSDESGTTGNFTNYLSVAAEDTWTAGEVEVWPREYGGEGGQGTSGVVSGVADGQNSIGYADASQAGDLGTASIQVGGEFVQPTAEAAANILAVSPKAESAEDNQLIYDLDYLTEEENAYPIVLTSYLIACPTYETQMEADVVKAYLEYVIGPEGQEQGANEAGAAPLEAGLQEEALAIVDQISAAS